MLNQQILSEARADAAAIAADRHALHAHPGTGFDIGYAVQYVTRRLTEMGYAPQPCGRAGVTATVGQGGRTFLLRADMDALPVQEASGVDFASEVPGKMHACGHDMHTAMLLEAARLLKQHESELQGTVKLMFQPAEEIFEGSADMIAAGVLQGVDAALMIHVTAAMPFAPGTVIACDGGVSAPACDIFDVTVQGKGCHGSMPNQGIDPIAAACAMVTALQELPAREFAISDEAVLTVGYLNAGNTNNVIPDTARFGGTLRTFDEELRANVKKRMQEMVQGIGAAYRTGVELVWPSSCPTLLNNADLAACIPGYLRELLGEQGCFTAGQLAAMAGPGKPQKGTGSEDFACVSQKVPSLMLALAAGRPQDGYCYPQHHPQVRFDEACLPAGAAVYAYAAARWLEEHRESK